MGRDYEKRIGGFSPSPIFRASACLFLCFSVFFFPWGVTFTGIFLTLLITPRPYEVFIPAFLLDILYSISNPMWFGFRFVFVFLILISFVFVEFIKQRIRFYRTP